MRNLPILRSPVHQLSAVLDNNDFHSSFAKEYPSATPEPGEELVLVCRVPTTGETKARVASDEEPRHIRRAGSVLLHRDTTQRGELTRDKASGKWGRYDLLPCKIFHAGRSHKRIKTCLAIKPIRGGNRKLQPSLIKVISGPSNGIS